MSSALPMPTDGDALEAFTGQPDLLALVDVSAPTVEAARRFLHTGKTTLRDERAAAAICAAAALGWSNRKIARDLGHSQDTVRAVVRLAEQAGKVGAVKDRVLASVAQAIQSDIELGNELAEKVSNGDDDAPDLAALAAFRKAGWVGAGILADKGAAAGPASVTIINQGDAVVNVVQDYAARLAKLAATDSASVGLGSIVEVSEAVTVFDAVPVVADAGLAGGSGAAVEIGNGAEMGSKEGGGGGAVPADGVVC
jgi:hypothetical protein